jgi:hypothetical protein
MRLLLSGEAPIFCTPRKRSAVRRMRPSLVPRTVAPKGGRVPSPRSTGPPSSLLAPDRPVLIHVLGSLCTTTTCRPYPRGAAGRRSHPRGPRRAIYARACKRTSMRRHCLSRADVAAGVAKPNNFRPSRYASIRTLRELTLFGGSVHRVRSAFIWTIRVLQSA